MKAVKVRKKNKKITVACSRFSRFTVACFHVSCSLHLVISRCCFAEEVKEMHQNVNYTSRAIIFAH